MSTNVEEIRKAALGLSEEDRAALAEDLLASLDGPERTEIDAVWSEEVERRLQAYDQGLMKSTPADEVFKSLETEDQS